FPRITSLGPLALFHTPMISIGTGSGSVPWNTVHAVACMPGRISARWKISDLPALGRVISAAWAHPPAAISAMANHRFLKYLLSLLDTGSRTPVGCGRNCLSLIGLQDFLPKPDGLRSDLDQFVVPHELDGLFQVQQAGRHQPDGFVGGRGAHVGELLLLDDI